MALTDKLTAIADAIREKGGTSELLTLDGMVDAISAIETGGDSDTLKALVTRSITALPNLDGITKIGINAFYQCSVMTGTVFPKTVTYIDDGAFNSCKKIAFVELPDDITYIGIGSFAGCAALPLSKLPKLLGSKGDWISSYSFQNCPALSISEIPSYVTGISPSAFENCTGIKSMHFPVAITLSNYVFNGCTGLETVTFSAKAKSISSTAFKNCPNLLTINVPWAEGEVANAPWGATNATINYNYTEVG